MDTGKAKCPECKLLFESSFGSAVKFKTCPCCEYVGPVSEFVCSEEEWSKKKGFKRSFLSSLKTKVREDKEQLEKGVKMFVKRGLRHSDEKKS